MSESYHPSGLFARKPPSTNVYLPTFIVEKYVGAADVARAASYNSKQSMSEGLYELM